MKKILCSYTNRASRADFIAHRFETVLHEAENILDVGCDENDLKAIAGSKVHGIDIAGSPDQFVDLELNSLADFETESFDAVVCAEVLEHVDNLHEVLRDLMRVAKKDVIISLPNCTSWSRKMRILKNATGKFYGLPDEKPNDRHKWFFSWQEIHAFFNRFTRKQGFLVEDHFLSINISPRSHKGRLLRLLLRLHSPSGLGQSYWIHIKKPA